jgi:hypothetical protein
VPAPALTGLSLEGDLDERLGQVPAAAGVAQMLGPDGRTLVIARAANLRRWAAASLGRGPRAAAGRRPRLDLSPVAREMRFVRTFSPFGQRLAYERLLAPSVPAERRRDLPVPAYLRLDLAVRFARLEVVTTPEPSAPTYGPFRDRKSAGKALAALHQRIPLRPCDYAFEPSPDLPLGLGCLYAQVRSCAAPCLSRVTEQDYQDLARSAAACLSTPESRADLAAVPAWVVGPGEGRALVVESVRGGFELFPLSGGSVLDGACASVPEAALEDALGRLEWLLPPEASDDRRWLSAWLHAPRRSGRYLILRDGVDPGEIARRLRHP